MPGYLRQVRIYFRTPAADGSKGEVFDFHALCIPNLSRRAQERVI
jgi:hypothetical protein